MTRINTTTLLFTALALGLAWAVRGHFGHEWGAAWAGGIGTLALILMSRREDWQLKAPILGSLGALGWGIGGMMSYGLVIGYCKGTDLGNVWYGYIMLAVIGGLYGFLGGGFVGLGLATSEEKKPDWASLVTQMVAGAYLIWGFFIFQLEWFMTPPRSELWAACLGAAGAMAWYMYRQGFNGATKVAIYTGLGAGFGFAFGNFIQTTMSTTGISYNWWNVMEFTLGAFGGLGMAYGVSKVSWPAAVHHPKWQNHLSLLFLLVFVPLINFTTAFSAQKLTRLGERLERTPDLGFIAGQQAFGLSMAIVIITIAWLLWQRMAATSHRVAGLFFGLATFYVGWSYIIKGVFLGQWGLAHSHSTYVPILLLLAFLWYKNSGQIIESHTLHKGDGIRPDWLLLAIILGTFLFAFISINLHDGLPGMQTRF